MKKENDEYCPSCKHSKRVDGDVWNCYFDGKLLMGKKDSSKPAKLCCMSWCPNFTAREE